MSDILEGTTTGGMEDKVVEQTSSSSSQVVTMVEDEQKDNEQQVVNNNEEDGVELLDDDEEEEDEALKKTRVGICAMDKKARSKPMAQILSRLNQDLFEIVFFGDTVLLKEPVENWPIVDVMIAFYSSGYPLDKAEQYAKLREPYVLNDLKMQRVLMDRRRVYDLLKESGIDVPRHVYMSRDGYPNIHTNTTTTMECEGDDEESELVEHDDHIEVNGVIIRKPFLEKPVNADDHNIAIYYPTSAGGGCKKLFRKIGDRSSEFYPDINEVRRDGSYIYEEFVETQGTDVKMYTVGPDYGHAEARKSPTVDGKVERNPDGKEVRFPVILTLREKEIARRIVIVFQQLVCGFDLLRVQEGDSLVSYVCDVNGWSFVKNSRKYYEDCAQILTEHMLAAVQPRALLGFSALDPLMTTMEDADSICGNNNDSTLFFQSNDNINHTPSTPSNNNNNTTNNNSKLKRAKKRILQFELPNSTNTTNNQQLPDTMIDNDPESDGNDTNSATIISNLNMSVNSAATLQEGALPVREYSSALATTPANLNNQKPPPSDTEEISAEEEKPRSSGKKANTRPTHQEELRCVISIVRHGDRTPKQKLKVHTSEPHVLEYFHTHCKHPKKDLKVKDKTPMTEFLETVRSIITEHEMKKNNSTKEKSNSTSTSSKSKSKDGKDQNVRDIMYKLRHMREVLERWKIGGLNRKLQIKPRKWQEQIDEDGDGTSTIIRCTEVLLILKWGGNLTKLGEKQSIRLGNRLREKMYPDCVGGGILRLHSTFRHDLKIKTSDEGRVMKTAAAFAKGMLELEGEIPPILVSLVHKEKESIHMLDPSGNKEVKNELDQCKRRVNKMMQLRDFSYDSSTVEEHEQVVGPKELKSMHSALMHVNNPRKFLFQMHSTIGELLYQLDEMLGVMGSGDEDRMLEGEGLKGNGDGDEALCGIKLYKGESLLELTERWRLLHKRLYDEEKDEFDLSRVPDVHDNVRFDMLHNPHLGLTVTLKKLYDLAKPMADCVVPQEYGTTTEEKISIGHKMCQALLEKIKYDLIIARTDNQVDMRYLINMEYSADLPINTMGRRIRTRLYFTSESHLHTLLNVFRFPGPEQNGKMLLSRLGKEYVNSSPELCYLTQVVIRLFENTNKELSDPRRFRIEILFSPGATATPEHMAELDRDLDNSRFDTEPLMMISKENLTSEELEEYFTHAIKEGHTEEDDELKDYNLQKSINKEKKDKSKQAKKQGKVESTGTTSTTTSSSVDVKSKKSSNGDNQNTSVSNQIETKTVKIVEENNTEIEDSSSNHSIYRQIDLTEEEKKIERMSHALAKKYIWTSIAAASFFLGIGCLALSRGFSDNVQSRRRWTKR